MNQELPPEDLIGYAERAQGALLDMVHDVLYMVAEAGLPGEHHFYISFDTKADGVEMSDALRAKHPETITIVLQNQFENMRVDEHALYVRLHFNGAAEDLVVPFLAITKFYDPAVAFGLMFESSPTPHADNADTPPAAAANGTDGKDGAAAEEARGEIIQLDRFRK